MIRLTRLDRQPYLLNPALIEQIAEMPDTVITLSNGKKLLVVERADTVAEAIRAWWRSVYLSDRRDDRMDVDPT